MNDEKRFVYVLRSGAQSATPLRRPHVKPSLRLDWHNAGQNEHTARDRPWHVIVSIEFRNAEAAGQFESYLKTGSGRAFAKRHFP